MLTCIKNFVDLTVWILRSWTCIKLNVILHRSLEKRRESPETAWRIRPRPTRPDPTPSSHRHTGPDQTGRNWIYPDWTSLFHSGPEGVQGGAANWTFWFFFCRSGCLLQQDGCGAMDGAAAPKSGWCLAGINCCMLASDGVFVFDALLYILKTNEGAFTLPAQSQFCNLKIQKKRKKIYVFFPNRGVDGGILPPSTQRVHHT